MQQQVRMAFDEAGQQGGVRQWNGGISGSGYRGYGAYGLDAVAASPDGPPLMHRLTIEDPGGDQHHAGTSRSGLRAE